MEARPSPPVELAALDPEKEPMVAGGAQDPPLPPQGPDPAPPTPPLLPQAAPLPPQGPAPALLGGEKNGLMKIPADEEGGEGGGGGSPKFTGLGKEELLRVAGAPPWARARAALLLLFWLGWLGMLGAAAAIVARAPRCAPLPPRHWWELGGLYRAPPRPFAGDLRGVAERLDHVAGLHMRGLVLGPLHPRPPQPPPSSPPAPSPAPSPLEQLDPALGSLQDLAQLLQAARGKGLHVILDLTPDPLGGDPWLGRAQDPQLHQEVTRAMHVWLQRGVAGFFLDGIEQLQPSVLAEWRNLTEANSTSSSTRLLVGGTRLRDPPALLRLLGSAGAGLVLGPFLEVLGEGGGSPPTPPPLGPTPSPSPTPALAERLLEFLRPGTPLAWSAGSPWQHLAALGPPPPPQRLLLLWALPGTPTLSYGDEVGLGGGDPPAGDQLTPMPWDVIDTLQEGDNRTEARLLELCRRLGELRAREHSLALGEVEAVVAPPPAVAFLRSWDQSERFLVVLNPEAQPLPHLALKATGLPPRATLRLSTHRPLPPDPLVDLGALELLPYEGLLLSFPYNP